MLHLQRQANILMIAVYLQDSIGMTGANLETISEIAQLIVKLGMEAIVAGDWNS